MRAELFPTHGLDLLLAQLQSARRTLAVTRRKSCACVHVRTMATVSQQSFVQGCNGMFESNAIADLPPPALVATFMRGVSQLLNALSLAAKLVTVKGSPSTYSRDFFSAWSSSVMSQVRELCFARTCLQQRWHGAHFVFHPQLVGQLREQTLPGAVYLRVKRQT